MYAISSKIVLSSISLISGLVALSVFVLSQQNVYAETPNSFGFGFSAELQGFAWAGVQRNMDGSPQGAGWISFNCDNPGLAANECASGGSYGESVDENGNLIGYAWSENIGWVQFGGLSGMPHSGMNARMTSEGELRGWARALAGQQQSNDGWDGWISLSCHNTGTCSTANYGVRFNQITGTVESQYAWGQNVMGWISFGQSMLILPPDIHLSNLRVGESDSFNVETLEYNNLPVQFSINNRSLVATPEDTAWVLTIANAVTGVEIGSWSGSVAALDAESSVAVQQIIPNIPSGTYLARVEAQPAFTVTPGGTRMLQQNFQLTLPDPGLTLETQPSIVRQGGSAVLVYDIETPYSFTCTIQGSGVNPGGVNANVYNFSVDHTSDFPREITLADRRNTSVYTFYCDATNADGDTWRFEAPETRVEVLPSFIEI